MKDSVSVGSGLERPILMPGLDWTAEEKGWAGRSMLLNGPDCGQYSPVITLTSALRL